MQLENEVYQHIRQMIDEEASRLEIVESCMSEFGDEYPDYEYDDWSKLVKSLMPKEDEEENIDIFIPLPTNVSSLGDKYKKAIEKLRNLIEWAQSSPVHLERWSASGVSKWNKLYKECLELCKCVELDYCEQIISEALYSEINESLDEVEEYTSRLPQIKTIDQSYLNTKLPVNYARRQKVKVPDYYSYKNKYLTLISSIPPTTGYERKKLMTRFYEGDKAAFDAVIESYLPLVYNMAEQFHSLYPHIDIQDFIGEGVCALISECVKYEERYGKQLIGYAMWGVKKRMASYVMEEGNFIHVPMRLLVPYERIARYIEKHQVRYGSSPSMDELSEAFKMPIDFIHDCLFAHDIKIETLDVCDYVYLLESESPAGKGLWNESLSAEISHALATLTPREADILRKFFGIGIREKTLEEIGDELHLTRERVRQIKEKAIRKLGCGNRSHLLQSYLGGTQNMHDIDHSPVYKKVPIEEQTNEAESTPEVKPKKIALTKEERKLKKALREKKIIEDEIIKLIKPNLNELPLPTDHEKRISHLHKLISESRKVIKQLHLWVSLKQESPSLEMVNIGDGRNIITYLDKSLAILEQEPIVAQRTINELRTNITFLHQKCDEQ